MTLFWQSFQSSSRESIVEHFLASAVMVRVTVLILDSVVLPHPLTAALPGSWLHQHTRTTACELPSANLRTEYIRDYPWRAAGGGGA